VSEGGGQGVLTLACLQDLSQARARWGQRAEGFLSLFPTTLVLPGIADRATLETLQHLAGREYVATSAVQRNAKGRPVGHSTNWTERDRVTLSELAIGRSGHALGLDEQKRLKWIELTPAYRDNRFRAYLERSSRERSLSRDR
jgi:hypothetical protein